VAQSLDQSQLKHREPLSNSQFHFIFMKPTIGFVGVGRMGANMARRLHSQGFAVTAVYDNHRASADSLAAEIGAKPCDTLAGVTAAADVIITVVTDDAAQLGVFAEGGDSLLVGAQGKTFVNCATVSPATHAEVERRAEAVGARTLEACMASSINQALAGTLYLMCGGKREVFDSVKDVLVPLSDDGKLLRYIGGTGHAAQLKALVNMVMNINTAGLAEGLGLADSLGLDLNTVMEVFSQTGANSRVLVTDGEDMVNRDHACFFSAAHAAKDSGIALALGIGQGLNLPLASATKAQYDRMVEAGFGDLDKSGIAELTFAGRGSNSLGG
jgi:3-hydroxyisobutyrate dehydrogenase